MRWIFPILKLVVVFLPLTVVSCSPLTREDVMQTARRYTDMRWIPESRHVRHGPDESGIVVHTPDRAEKWAGDSRGWWKPGVAAKGMPYMWGGFDTPESFARKIAAGYRAGDVGNEAKRALGDGGVSSESAGIDCSGFVSRCWGLARPYSTRELHKICDPLPDWAELKPGDILLNHRHVVLFSRWLEPGKIVGAYEAGPFPVWRANANGLRKSELLRMGYKPWRYKGLRGK